ncbi:MAG: hypothetical protein KatS3mg131_1638 [Candidatus Tectimicrobiota bacterium]|nr:MAG: hypothetical protein KatS3mg131_1638 [Candidatus Tectomicrobia bacterium]
MLPYTLSLSEAARRIRAGELSPLDLMAATLRWIDAVEPRLQAWVTLDRQGAPGRGQALQ